MLGQSTWGMYFAYGALGIVFLLIIVMFLRLVAMLSLLFLSPASALIRRLRGIAPLVDPPQDGRVGGEP